MSTVAIIILAVGLAVTLLLLDKAQRAWKEALDRNERLLNALEAYSMGLFLVANENDPTERRVKAIEAAEKGSKALTWTKSNDNEKEKAA